MGARNGSGKGPMAALDVTPLINVVLLLLVVFMVITPMLQSGMSVELPMASQTTTVNDVGQHITISVTTDQGVWVEEEQVELETLIAQVNHEYRIEPARSILVKADSRLEYRTVREVMDILAENGMNTVLIAADKE